MNQLTDAIQGDQSMATGFSYDNWNNNTSITYPSGISITNTFNTDGYLTEIKNSGSLIWKLDETNSLGQPVQFSLGSSGLKTNFEYDTKGYLKKKTTGTGEQSFGFDPNTGNLSYRKYRITTDTATLREYFSYDNMNRLYTSKIGLNAMTVNYSANGNISFRTNTGTFTYDNNRKNAVTSVTNSSGVIPTTQQIITYTGFNKASSVTEGTYNLVLTYGPGNQRIKSVMKNNGNPVKTKYYSGSYEKEITGSTRELHYINSPYGLAAILVKQGTTTTTYYTETDHLGSIVGLLNAGGSYAEKFSFDPWGRRRNPANWTFTGVPQPVLTDRGFTGHEHLDQFGLINMNGRIYDPVIGRFLGVDPVIQAPDNSQSFNGYSYCLNNPLKYTDPSGYLYNPGFNLRMWQLIVSLWDKTPEGEKMDFTSDGVGGWQGVRSGSGFQGPGQPYMLGEVTVTSKAPQKNTPTTPTYESNSLSPWLGWTNNGINAAAYGAYEAGGSIRLIKGGSLNFQYYASAWTGGSRARITTYNISKIGTGVGVGTSITGSVMGGINFALSDKSWGDYGQLGISLVSAGLTLGGPTTPIGIGIGVMDLAGGFNGFYNYLDANQQFYNNTGLIILPNNMGLPVYIKF